MAKRWLDLGFFGLTLAAATAFGCGGSGGASTFPHDAGQQDATVITDGSAGQDSPQFGTHDSSIGDGSQGDASVFAISPAALQTITVNAGQSTPTVTYTATLGGSPVSAAWTVDRGDLGLVPAGPSTTGVFTPAGSTGGLVTVTAGFNGKTAQGQVFIKLTAQQNGASMSASEQSEVATSTAQLTAGGGVGGVGGEGLGGTVTDQPTLTALQNPSGNGQAQGLAFLYPYNGTVWPRGILAPLLMWTWATNNADAIQVSLATTSGSFSWTGTFGPPAILMQTGGPFIRMPIPQDVWTMATNTAGGPTPGNVPDQLTVSLTIAKGGVGYGPITETWPVAPGLLSGIIYYNSYGTQLAQNLGGAVGGNGMFGGAVLSIHVGDTGPQLVAGSSGGLAQCRTCHSVAAGGSALVVQHGDNYSASSAYELTPMGAVENVLATGSSWFPAVYPDGSLALTESGQVLPLPDDSVLPTVNGLNTIATDIGTPTFSPDGSLVAFNAMAGPGVMTPTQQMLVMGFDAMTTTFSGPAVVVVDDTGKPADTRPGWPAFFPDGKSLVFHHQSVAGNDGNSSGSLYTREGCQAQIAWTSAADATHVTVLNQLNGLNAANTPYLPQLAQPINLRCTGDGAQVGTIDPIHANDINYNYEPTVNPIATGGYVWIVFTSRRMYGSEADIPPFCSDPRGVNLITNTTPKKLWVAAVDLNAPPGSDASHPAFYLPGQELLAGNSRGFWVLAPCMADGQSCQAGDQCCNGYCEPDGDGGALICANTPPNNNCSGLNDKCATAADCCDPTNLCINGFCTQGGVQ